jgi:coenzyme F420-reducing hydrogenase delta subunit
MSHFDPESWGIKITQRASYNNCASQLLISEGVKRGTDAVNCQFPKKKTCTYRPGNYMRPIRKRLIEELCNRRSD